MKLFMAINKVPLILHLVEEILDFKRIIAPFIASDDKSLDGHGSAQQFKFYNHSNRLSMMQYKINCLNSDWLSKEGGIKLWKEDDSRKPLLPKGKLIPLASNCMKNLDDIVKGLGSFINLWDTMGAIEHWQKHEHLNYY